MSAADTLMSVIIVSYNTHDHLERCLEALVPHPLYRVIVVDNGSTDSSAALVQARYSHVLLLTSERNMGYGGGANLGIVASTTPYLLLLNSDTIVAPDAITALVTYLDKHPRAAIVGPRLRNVDGSLQPSCYPFPTPLHVFLEESTLGRWIRYLPFVKEQYWRTWTHDKARVVPWVLGAALAMRRDALQQVGGFDPAFFMYYEEVDLAYRLTQAAWEIHFAPVADIVHVGGASTVQHQGNMVRRLFQSLIQFYRKHYSPMDLVLLRGIVSFIMILRVVRETIFVAIFTITQNKTRLMQIRTKRHTWITTLQDIKEEQYAEP